MAFPSGWAWKCPLAIDHTKVTADLYNKDVLFVAANMPTGGSGDFWTNVQAGGGDIRFTSDAAGATPLHFEVVEINTSTPTTQIWVNVPYVASGVNTTIYVWYKNPAATMPAANDPTWGSQGVWDANYVGVWHMDDATGADVLDSTANAVTLAQTNSPTQGTAVIDGGLTFNGSNQRVNGTSPDLSGATTVEQWLNAQGNGWYLGNFNSAGSYCQVGLYYGPYWAEWDIYINYTNYYWYWHSVGFGNYNHVAFTNDGAGNAGSCLFYANGESQSLAGSNPHTPPAVGNCGSLGFGRAGDGYPTGGVFTACKLDEVRISNIVRSADWIKTGYNNQNAPAAFSSPGTPVMTASETSMAFVDGAFVLS